jgi:hypothetical protein
MPSILTTNWSKSRLPQSVFSNKFTIKQLFYKNFAISQRFEFGLVQTAPIRIESYYFFAIIFFKIRNILLVPQGKA